MLHAVDAGSAAAMRTGMRVRPRWAADRVGSIRDIACFEPCGMRHPGRREAPEVPEVALAESGRRSGHDDGHAGAAALPAHRLARGEHLPARPGRRPADRAAVPRVREGVHPVAGDLPGRRRAHRHRGRAARHRDRHHLLHRERGLPRPAGHAALRGGGGAARRGGHRLPAPHPRLRARRGADRHARAGGVAPAGRVGHDGRRPSATSRRPASRTPPTRPYARFL